MTTYFFRSDSDPDKLYQTLEQPDGSTSCDCPGWTRRNPPGGRTCKHTRLVIAGFGSNQAVRILHAADELYSADVRAAARANPKPAKASVRFGQLGKRKFAAV